MPLTEALHQLFGDALLALWITLTAAAGLAGLWSLLAPETFLRFNRRASRWVEAGETDRLPRTLAVERPFYRHHRLTGGLLMAGSFYCLYAVLFQLEPAAVKHSLAQGNPWREVLVDAAFGYIYLVSIAVFLVGFVVLVRPSLLKNLESWSNRWVETGNQFKKIDKRTDFLDKWVARHPRVFGIFALCGGFASAWLLWRYYGG